jgi:hypothetical protein
LENGNPKYKQLTRKIPAVMSVTRRTAILMALLKNIEVIPYNLFDTRMTQIGAEIKAILRGKSDRNNSYPSCKPKKVRKPPTIGRSGSRRSLSTDEIE